MLPVMPSVLLLHAWWGRTPLFMELGQRFTEAGFQVEIPDLYGDGRTAESVEEAEALSDALEVEQMMARVEQARQLLPEPVAVVGFSMGAWAAIKLLAKDPTVKAAVLYYGTNQLHSHATTSCAVLGHYAEQDPFEPLDQVRELEQRLQDAGARSVFRVYNGTQHWFAEPDRPEYDAAASALAWTRTMDFLHRELR
jgi:carboxymethylenebutenolidase